MNFIECIPNVSEGRKRAVVASLAEIVKGAPETYLLDYSSDVDHNRSVFTYVTTPDHFLNGAISFVGRAYEQIQIEQHEGVHPYLGVVDVFPLVPLPGTSIETCVALARRLGERVAHELEVPVYYYGQAALQLDRANLADVRRGGYALLKEEIASGHRTPDQGPAQLHPTAGAISIGVRPFLIAYNINLQSVDLPLAVEIAKGLREKYSGLMGVRALGLPLRSRGLVQVSMNLTDSEQVSLRQVFDWVRERASRRGVTIRESELIGLIPEHAVFPDMADYLKLTHFSEDRILERAIAKQIELLGTHAHS